MTSKEFKKMFRLRSKKYTRRYVNFKKKEYLEGMRCGGYIFELGKNKYILMNNKALKTE